MTGQLETKLGDDSRNRCRPPVVSLGALDDIPGTGDVTVLRRPCGSGLGQVEPQFDGSQERLDLFFLAVGAGEESRIDAARNREVGIGDAEG